MAHSSNEYQRNYLQMWRERKKLLNSWQDQSEDRIEAKYVKYIPYGEDDPMQEAMNRLTYALLYKASKKMREIDSFEEEQRLYIEVDKRLETCLADMKEHGFAICSMEFR